MKTKSTVKKYVLNIEGNEFGASVHDLSLDNFNSLRLLDINIDNISNLLDQYDPWATNYFHISKPLNDDNLNLVLKNINDGIIWNSKASEYNDIYDHSNKFPEITHVDFWDEFVFNGDAIPCNEHPYILYYQEINRGDVTKFIFESDTIPNPSDFSIVFGTIETDEFEFEYIEKIYFKEDLLLESSNIERDLKEISMDFKLYSI